MERHYDADRAAEPAMMKLGATLSTGHMRSAQMRQAANVSLSVMIAAEAAGNVPLLIDTMNTRGTAIPALGRGTEGGALLREALRLSEIAGIPFQTLRALNNLNVIEASNGNAALIDANRRGYELAQRIHHGALLVRFTTGYAGSLVERGRYEEALEVLGSVEAGEESLWADNIEGFKEQIHWVQTGDAALLERVRELNQSGLDAHEPQYQGHAMSFEAGFRWIEGDLSGAIEIAEQGQPELAHPGPPALRGRGRDQTGRCRYAPEGHRLVRQSPRQAL